MKNSQEEKLQKGSAVTPLVVGAAIGAAAVVLSDEEKRKKVMDKMNQVGSDVRKRVEGIQGHAKEKLQEMRGSVEAAKKDVAHKLEGDKEEAVDQGAQAVGRVADKVKREADKNIR